MLFYTLTASLPLLMVIIFIGSQSGTFSFYQVVVAGGSLPYLLGVFLVLGFLVKLPVFGVHL